MPDDRHPTTDELADLMFGMPKRSQGTRIKAHVAGCAACAEVCRQLWALPGLLASTRYPPIPRGASLRIEAVLAVEARRRSAGGSRHEGVVDSAAGLDLFAHVCLVYHGKADWVDRAEEFAADGITAGQRIRLIGDASTARIRSELAARVRSMPGVRALDGGPAEVRDLAEYVRFTSEGIPDPGATVAAHREALDDALAAGYTGVRVVTDATGTALTHEERETTAHLEYVIDRNMSALPVGSMCGYDVEELGPDAIAEVACMHPFTSRGAAPFRLYAVDDADFGLAGTIDDATAEGLFRRALGRTDPPAGSELVVNARRAEYIADRALAELDAHAGRMGRTAIVHTSTSNSPNPEARPALSSLTIEAGDGP